MSKRLQVLLEDAEMREVRRAARRAKRTVSEWVRAALRQARRAEEPEVAAAEKLEAVRRAARHAFPTADVEQMLEEIGRGYHAGGP